jgi:hypothetical protein
MLHHAYEYDETYINDEIIPAIYHNQNIQRLGEFRILAQRDDESTVDVTDSNYSKFGDESDEDWFGDESDED